MKFAMGLILICLGVVILPFSLLEAQKVDMGLARGMWSGRATGTNVKSYSVTVALDGTGVGFVEYPSLKCGGKLRFVRQIGNQYSYRETITHGQTRCGAAGQLVMIPDGDQLYWTRDTSGKKVTATLTNVDNPGPHACTTCELSYDQSVVACYRLNNADDRQKCQDNAEEARRACEQICEEQ